MPAWAKISTGMKSYDTGTKRNDAVSTTSTVNALSPSNPPCAANDEWLIGRLDYPHAAPRSPSQ
jgi:hypothetical protein